MTIPLGFFFLALAGLVTMVAALLAARDTAKISRRLVVPAAPPAPTPKDEWEIDVEVIHVPAKGSWEDAIQKQLDAIEGRDPNCQLVTSVVVEGKIILFYKRRA